MLIIAFSCICKEPAIGFLGCCTATLQFSIISGYCIAHASAKVEKETHFFSSFLEEQLDILHVRQYKHMGRKREESTQKFPENLPGILTSSLIGPPYLTIPGLNKMSLWPLFFVLGKWKKPTILFL